MSQRSPRPPLRVVEAPDKSFGEHDGPGKPPDRLRPFDVTRKLRPYGRKEFPTSRTHGTRATYNAGCGCEDCTRAERIYSRERYRALRDAPVDAHYEALTRARAGVRMLEAGEVDQARLLFAQACEWAG